jgi:glycosyltransferase involved in cell wall biosynthesis
MVMQARMSDLDSRPISLLILIPVFNDWSSLTILLARLDEVLHEQVVSAQVVAVDDGSTEPVVLDGASGPYRAITKIEVLELRRNLGHQRAIAVGLAYIQSKVPGKAVLIMDGDGEDDPNDVPRLVRQFQRHEGRKVIFAGRSRRSESLLFRIFYRLFKLMHLLLTGHRVQVGNFSLLPRPLLDRLVVASELWNHYAAAVYKAQLPFDIVPTQRGRRLAGRSRMNFVSLVIHGLSAIAVFGDIVGVRLLVVIGLLMPFAALSLMTTVVLRLATDWAIPGWATYTTGLLMVLLLQAVMLSLIFIFLVLSTRQGSAFLPVRDYHYYCQDTKRVYPAP